MKIGSAEWNAMTVSRQELDEFLAVIRRCISKASHDDPCETSVEAEDQLLHLVRLFEASGLSRVSAARVLERLLATHDLADLVADPGQLVETVWLGWADGQERIGR